MSELGIRVIGTLGVVLCARREGRIATAVETLQGLRKAGLRLDDEVRSDTADLLP